MADQKLFVYGLLTRGYAQKAKLGREVPGERDSLGGYEESDIRMGEEVFSIISHGRGYIDGLVLTLTEEELARVDEFEPDDYERIKVTLESGQEAWAYVKKG